MAVVGSPKHTRLRSGVNPYNNVTINGDAGEQMAPGMAVYPSAAGIFSLADSLAIGTATAVGITLTAGNAPNDGPAIDIRPGRGLDVVTLGPISGFAALTQGADYFVSDTVPGELMELAELTIGSVISRVGYALSPTELFVQPMTFFGTLKA